MIKFGNALLKGIAIFFSLLSILWGSLARAQVISGDYQIDEIISTFPLAVGGSGGGVNYNSAEIVLCNSPEADPSEANCPNDITYVPSGYTGGYQAWGVGIRELSLIYWTFNCYLVPRLIWDTNNNVYFNWVFDCGVEVIEEPPITTGVAKSIVKWGQDPGLVIPNDPPELSQVSNYVSTAAFKASDLTECTPIYQYFLSAPCNGDSDATYVDSAGVEINIVIPDPECDISFSLIRSGTGTDAAYGCFTSTAGGWETNLPNPYLDTTYSDPEDTFIASVGTGYADLIQEGQLIESKIIFVSSGRYLSGETLAEMQATPVHHTASITAYIPSSPICSPAVVGNPLCHFTVDQTNIGYSSSFQLVP